MLKKIAFLTMFVLAPSAAQAIDAACTQTTNLSIYRCPENSVDWYSSYTGIVDGLDRLAKTAISSFTVQGSVLSNASMTASGFFGNGSQVTSLTASNISSGNLGSSVVASSVAAIIVPATCGSSTISCRLTFGADGRIQSTSSSTITSTGDAVLSATQTFSGANTFTSTVAVIGARMGIGTSSPSEVFVVEESVQNLADPTAYIKNTAVGTTGNPDTWFSVDNASSSVRVGIISNSIASGNKGSFGTSSNHTLSIITNNTARVTFPTSAITTGGALCLNSSSVLSKCTSAVDASGNCTCP